MTVVLIVFLLIVLFITVSIVLGHLFSSPAYQGQLSDHFDGKKFRNPGGTKAKGFKDLWKWMRNRTRGVWKERMDLKPGAPPAKRVEGDKLVVTFVNHSTFLLQTSGLNILTDPVWSDRASPVSFAGPKRMRPPGIRYEDLHDIDLVLLTHNHYDHLDIQTMKRLWKDFQPVVYCPLGVGKYLKRKGIKKVIELDWWGETEYNEQLKIVSTPAQHFSGRGMFDRDRTLWCGFALMTKKGSIYYSGDTGYGNFFKEIAERISPTRLSFLPIGAYKPQWFMSPIHTSPSDALRIHEEIGSPVSIAMHYGTFPLADDSQSEPEEEVRQIMKEKDISKEEFLVLEEGESWVEPISS
jgi:L-ascorbate metabolism protein UlaG (beta-lactamase superfamily)